MILTDAPDCAGRLQAVLADLDGDGDADILINVAVNTSFFVYYAANEVKRLSPWLCCPAVRSLSLSLSLAL